MTDTKRKRNSNSPTSITDIELEIETRKKTPDPNGFTVEFYKTFYKLNNNNNFIQNHSENREERNFFQDIYKVRFTLITKPNKDRKITNKYVS